MIERDRGWSWLVLLLAITSQIIWGGYCNNGGIFYIIFSHAFSTDVVTLSWLCSLPSCILFISSPVGSYLSKKYSFRVAAAIGGVGAAVAISTGQFATGIIFLFITHGIMTGLGLGINMTATNVAIARYFDRYRVVALGLTSLGNNIGLIIYARFLVFLEQFYGWRGMLLIIGAVTLHLCICAAVMFPITKTKPEMGEESVKMVEPPTVIMETKEKLVDCTIFRKASFICFCISNIFFNTGYGIFSIHLPSYSIIAGFKETELGQLWLAHGGCNIVGKVVFTFLGNHRRVNVSVAYSVALVLGGVSMGILPHWLSRTGILFLSGACGFFICVTGALINSVIYDIVGQERFADGTGMSMPFKAIGNLIGGPIAGILFSVTRDYKYSFYLGGVSMAISGLLMALPIYQQLRKRPTPKTGL